MVQIHEVKRLLVTTSFLFLSQRVNIVYWVLILVVIGLTAARFYHNQKKCERSLIWVSQPPVAVLDAPEMMATFAVGAPEGLWAIPKSIALTPNLSKNMGALTHALCDLGVRRRPARLVSFEYGGEYRLQDPIILLDENVMTIRSEDPVLLLSGVGAENRTLLLNFDCPFVKERLSLEPTPVNLAVLIDFILTGQRLHISTEQLSSVVNKIFQGVALDEGD